jgi:hypothetical protein
MGSVRKMLRVCVWVWGRPQLQACHQTVPIPIQYEMGSNVDLTVIPVIYPWFAVRQDYEINGVKDK